MFIRYEYEDGFGHDYYFLNVGNGDSAEDIAQYVMSAVEDLGSRYNACCFTVAAPAGIPALSMAKAFKRYFDDVEDFIALPDDCSTLEFGVYLAHYAEQHIEEDWLVRCLSTDAYGWIIGMVDMYNEEFGCKYPCIKECAENLLSIPLQDRLYAVLDDYDKAEELDLDFARLEKENSQRIFLNAIILGSVR